MNAPHHRPAVATTHRPAVLGLDGGTGRRGLTGLSPFIEADRAQAVADLAAGNHFAPLDRDAEKTDGPYVLHLSIHEGRLMFDIRAATTPR